MYILPKIPHVKRIPNIGHGLETLEIVYYLLDCFDHGESHIYTIWSMLWSWNGKTRDAVVAVAKYFDSHALVFLNKECAYIILNKYSLNLDSSVKLKKVIQILSVVIL